MDGCDGYRVIGNSRLFIAVTGVFDGQGLVALTEQDLNDLKAIVGDAATVVDCLRIQRGAFLDLSIATHLKTGQSKTWVCDRITFVIKDTIKELAAVRVVIIGVEHVQCIDVTGLGSRCTFLFTYFVAFIRQHYRLQQSSYFTGTHAALDNQGAADLAEILVLRLEYLDLVVATDEVGVGSDRDVEPLIPVTGGEGETILEYAIGIILIDHCKAAVAAAQQGLSVGAQCHYDICIGHGSQADAVAVVVTTLLDDSGTPGLLHNGARSLVVVDGDF